MLYALIAAVTLAGGVQASAPAQAAASTDKTLNLAAYVELLRSDLRTGKIAILTEVMGFTEAEDTAFWPIYRAYDAEMTKLADERIALIKDYAASYSAMTNEKAASLAQAAINLESRRSAAKAACYEKVKAALNPQVALRFLQVEHQLQLLIDLQVAAMLPVAPVAGKGK